MRFLLNSAATASSKPRVSLGSSKNASRVRRVAAARGDDSNSQINSNAGVQWGQQCSPNCGCVVRFETTIDVANNTVLSSTYHARSVLTTTNAKGSLSPRLTQNAAASTGATSPNNNNAKGRPILTACKCPTVHKLSSQITASLPGMSLDRLYNSTEFSLPRSSHAFRRTVLVQNGLSRSSMPCYDLVEEAFVASVKGHMPRPRRVEEYMYYKGDKSWRQRTDSSGSRIYSDDDTYAATATHASRGIDVQPQVNPVRYADAARNAGKVFPPHVEEKYHTDDAPARAAADTSTVSIDAVSSSSMSGSFEGSGMPAFHLSSKYANEKSELVHRYDDELDAIRREVAGVGHSNEAAGVGVVDNAGSTGGAIYHVDDHTHLDWLSYVDDIYQEGGGKQSGSSIFQQPA